LTPGDERVTLLPNGICFHPEESLSAVPASPRLYQIHQNGFRASHPRTSRQR
jgi:hypothetical protein